MWKLLFLLTGIAFGAYCLHRNLNGSVIGVGSNHILLVNRGWEKIVIVGRVEAETYEEGMEAIWLSIDELVRKELLGISDEEWDW